MPSPLNPDVKPSFEAQHADDASQSGRSKPVRAKKDTLKKREAKGGDSNPATPDPKARHESEPSENRPLRYKLAPPKLSDFDPPRGPVMTLHHRADGPDGQAIEFMETSDQ